jgi:hypothetical protein
MMNYNLDSTQEKFTQLFFGPKTQFFHALQSNNDPYRP